MKGQRNVAWSGRMSMTGSDNPGDATSALSASLAAGGGGGGARKGIIESRIPFWQKAFAEFIGAALCMFVGGGIVAITGNIEAESLHCYRILAIALVDGFMFYALSYLTMKLSGGASAYFNPSITLSLGILDMCFDQSYSSHISRMAKFMFAQFVGAIFGFSLILLAVPDALVGVEKAGLSRLTLGEPAASGWLLEAVLSFFFVMIVLSVRRNEKRRSSIILAFAYAVVRLLSFPLTGGSINPARALAPALVANVYKHVYIFILASPIGAVVGTFVFIFLHKSTLDFN